jgi:hypothetical protein
MGKASDFGKAHLRVARPTGDVAAVIKFYQDGLGFDVLYEFKDHDGFDAVMLGRKGAAYHLEFTRKALSAKFWLQPVGLARNFGFSPKELRRVQKLVIQHQAEFLEAWHGHLGAGGCRTCHRCAVHQGYPER